MTLTIHNRCDVRPNGDNPNRGTCRDHSVPVYLDGNDWHTDHGIGRRAS